MAEARRNPLWVFSVLLLLLVFAFCFLDAKLDTKAHSSGLDVDNERLKWASSTYKLENSAIPPKDIPISQPTKSIHNLPPLHFVTLPKGSVPPSGGKPPIQNPPEIKNLNFGMLPKGPVAPSGYLQVVCIINEKIILFIFRQDGRIILQNIAKLPLKSFNGCKRSTFTDSFLKLDTKAHSSGLDVDNERLKWASSTYKLVNSAIPPKDIPISQPTKSIHNVPQLHFVTLPKGSVPPSGGKPPIHNLPEIKNLNFGMLPKGPVPPSGPSPPVPFITHHNLSIGILR
ncbi:hypothetical protein GH714_018126 [Hevea brasiliensis]|uniref:Uncharacterized protein n=1 Tax=Hevea brasiliensis TaxID=3981 RepID=A0A6A6N563_HEVBR|nr:hypothetical protein GH714_018126 [Hevea brasiliensis]